MLCWVYISLPPSKTNKKNPDKPLRSDFCRGKVVLEMSTFGWWWCNIKPTLISKAKVQNSGYASSLVHLRSWDPKFLLCLQFCNTLTFTVGVLSPTSCFKSPHLAHTHSPFSPADWDTSVYCCLHFSQDHVAPWYASCLKGWTPHKPDWGRHLHIQWRCQNWPLKRSSETLPLVILYVYNIGIFKWSLNISYLKLSFTFVPDVSVRLHRLPIFCLWDKISDCMFVIFSQLKSITAQMENHSVTFESQHCIIAFSLKMTDW